VQLEKEAAGVAQDRAGLIAPPERSGACGAVLADGLAQSQSRFRCGLSIGDHDKDKKHFGRFIETRE
jgi:hypothetical protein